MGLSLKIYKKVAIHRYDDVEYIRNFKYSDFEGIKKDDYSFKSKGYTLNGGFFYKEGYKKDHLVIFCHGIGGGYASYMREIATICERGYKVLAFDYIGCNSSEGKDIISMGESLVNLYSLIDSLKDKEEYIDKKITIIDHSWGGYAASNIPNYVDNIHAIIDISGFISLETFFKAFVRGAISICRPALKRYEKKANPSFYNSNAIDALNKTKAKILVIHDENDNMVKYEYSSLLLKENVHNPNFQLIITNGKHHNPNYTYDAVNYMREIFGKYSIECKKKRIKTLDDRFKYFKDVDWLRMTEQDKDIWNKIFDVIGE